MFVVNYQPCLDILPRLLAMYRFYQVIICLLKFDFFCFTGVTMQVGLAITRKPVRPQQTILAIDHRVVRELGRVWSNNRCHTYRSIVARRCRLRRPERNKMVDDRLSDTHVGSRIILQVVYLLCCHKH